MHTSPTYYLVLTIIFSLFLSLFFQVSLVNFAITFSGLEEQLLGIVVMEETPEMEQKKNAIMIISAKMKGELQEIEDIILAKLSNAAGNLLDDHELITTLAASKVKSQEILVKVKEAEGTEKLIDNSRDEYRSTAVRGSILYFCIADMATIDSMYQFSLQWFKGLYVQCIHSSPPSQDISARLQSLNDFLTYQVYKDVCRSLFEKHKMLFSFLVAVRILQQDDVMDPTEWQFLISGVYMYVCVCVSMCTFNLCTCMCMCTCVFDFRHYPSFYSVLFHFSTFYYDLFCLVTL